MSRKAILPKPTLFEKTMAHVAPGFAGRVYHARCALFAAESYTGASRTRRALSSWDTSDGDADSDILPYLDDLRERSRDLVRSNSLAGSAIATKVTSVVGTGLKLQSRINRDFLPLDDEQADLWERKTEAEYQLFCKECDIERTLNLEAMQELAFRSVLENGDLLALSPYKKYTGDTYGLKIQLIEADRICNDGNATDSESLAGGVEKEDSGAVKRFHVLDTHPGNKWKYDTTWTKYDAFSESGRRNAWLLYHKIRIGQSRGVPDIAPVIEDLKQLGRYKEAELMATVVASLFTVFVKTESGEGADFTDTFGETGGKSSDEDLKLAPGMVVDLAEGEDIVTANPNRPNPAFESFLSAITGEISARLELPREVLTKHFSSSYSAARGALLEAWKYFLGRRKWLADNFCRPIYELFLTEAVTSGRIHAPGFLSGNPLIREAWLGSDWVGDAPGHLDEGKAADAAIKRINGGLSNESIEVTALTGRDRDAVYRQSKKEREQRRADNMLLADQEPEGQVPENNDDDEK